MNIFVEFEIERGKGVKEERIIIPNGSGCFGIRYEYKYYRVIASNVFKQDTYEQRKPDVYGKTVITQNKLENMFNGIQNYLATRYANIREK